MLNSCQYGFRQGMSAAKIDRIALRYNKYVWRNALCIDIIIALKMPLVSLTTNCCVKTWMLWHPWKCKFI